jgi:hypothetical protein
MTALLLALLLVCPPWGSATTATLKHQDTLKNRTGSPVQFQPVTVAKMLSAKDGAWAEGAAGELVGWVVLRKHAGPESCNCFSKTQRDWHLLISGDAGEKRPTRCVVVEITPREPLAVPSAGSHVRVRGWFFLDSHHKGEPNRGTLYELHPVTSIAVLN